MAHTQHISGALYLLPLSLCGSACSLLVVSLDSVSRYYLLILSKKLHFLMQKDIIGEGKIKCVPHICSLCTVM